MKQIYTLISFLILSASCVCAQMAQEISTPFTLEHCIELATRRSIPLANALRDEEAARAKIKQTKAQIYPQVSVEARYTRLDEEPLSFGDPTAQTEQDLYNVTAAGSQLLYAGGSVKAAIDAAQNFEDISILNMERTERELVRQVKKSFYELLYLQENLNVARASLEQLEDFVKDAGAKYKQGTISEFDYLSAQVRLANERPNYINATNKLNLARQAFVNLLYLDSESVHISGELSCTNQIVCLEQLTEHGVENRPEIRTLEAQIRLRQADVRVSKGNYMPDIYAYANYSGDSPNPDTMSGSDWEWEWNAGLQARWSFLDGGLRRAEILEKKMSLLSTKAKIEDLKRQIRLEIKNAYLELEHAKQIVESGKENVSLAQRALEIANVSFHEGMATYLDVTEANVALKQARQTLLLAQLQYQQALADLEYAGATYDFTSLETDNENE